MMNVMYLVSRVRDYQDYDERINPMGVATTQANAMKLAHEYVKKDGLLIALDEPTQEGQGLWLMRGIMEVDGIPMFDEGYLIKEIDFFINEADTPTEEHERDERYDPVSGEWS